MKFIIAGCGHIAHRRASVLSAAGAQLVFVDLIGSRAEAFEQQYGGLAYANVDQALADHADADACLICTPPSAHLEIAIKAADKSLYLFIEKPLAGFLDKDAIEKLVRILQVRGRWAMMGQSYRHLQSIKDLSNNLLDKRVLSANIWTGQYLGDWHIGEDYSQSYSARKGDGGVVLDCLGHSLDWINYIFGEIKSICALVDTTSCLDIATEDNVTCLVQMESGAQITLHADYLQPSGDSTIRGVAVGAKNNLVEFSWKLDRKSVESMYQREMEKLIKALTNHYLPQPDVYQGILIMEWITAVNRFSVSRQFEGIENWWAKLAGRA